jgi:hypothetical protein
MAINNEYTNLGGDAPAMDAMDVLREQESEYVGRVGPIGKDEIKKALETFMRYRQGKEALDARIVENEEWFKLRHWDQFAGKKINPADPRPASAWLLNSIANKHADAMDNYPVPAVLPRERDDQEDAKALSEILPVVLEQNEFEQTYSDLWWYKLKTGTGVYGVFWDPDKNNGLGDIDIRDIDLLNLFWEPGILDIQKSRNLFHVEMVDSDLLEQRYPFLEGKTASANMLDTKKYLYDETINLEGKSPVVDWYYKVKVNGRTVVHFCKFAYDEVLYASENDPAYAERGFYDHGKYPFIFDTLFPVAGSPAGFGYLDVCKEPQKYIDKLDQFILKSSMMHANPRFFVKENSGVNEEEYADWNKSFVHYNGTGDPREAIMPLVLQEFPAYVVQIRDKKVDELKETSGNRDFSQGGTASGVTAASAIAALQEAGSKLSRDIIKASYRAFAQVNYLCIELIRQFYSESRWFRITGPMGDMRFEAFSGQRIAPKPQGADFGMDMGYRVPIFDVKVSSQKSSPFSTVAQNERAKELYGLGFFRPDLADQSLAALEMMQFEGIEQVRERIAKNQTLLQMVQQLGQLSLLMAAELDRVSGTQFASQVAQVMGMPQQAPPQGAGNVQEVQTNPLGDAMNDDFNQGKNSRAGAARAKAAEMSTPKV